MKRILVPTDFSSVSLEALKFATELATSTGGELHVLHVINMPIAYTTDLDGYDYAFDPRVVKELHDNAEKKFASWKKKYTGNLKNINFHLEYGTAIITIENFIRKNKVDMLVMGTHGVSGIKEFFIGSNTEKVVRFSKVPVFAIRKAVKLSSIKNIVFPTQLKLNEAGLVKQVKALQKLFNAKLQIVYVNTPVNFLRSKELEILLKEYVKHYAFTNCVTNIVNDPYEQDGIISFANNTPGAVVAMGTHGRRGLAHFFNQSIAEDVVNHVTCPIWTYSTRKK